MVSMRKKNEYRFDVLETPPTTKGFESLGRDNINTPNDQVDLPIDVALQAGNLKQLRRILRIPGCNPTLLSRKDHEFYIERYRKNGGDIDIAAEMRVILKNAVEKWVILHPSRTGGVIPPRAKKAALTGVLAL